MRLLGATNDAELAEFLDVGPAAVSAWRTRGVSKKARRAFEKLRPDVPHLSEMNARYASFPPETRGKGLCLALYLAPSCDAVATKRFSEFAYNGALEMYASLFREIEVACMDEVATRMDEEGISAVEALNSLGKEPVADLYDRVISRALLWKNAGYAAGQSDVTLHEPRPGFRGK